MTEKSLSEARVVNEQSGTTVTEVAQGIFRISTPVPKEKIPPVGTNIFWTADHSRRKGFSFNQYLIVDDEPLLFHSGTKGMYPLTKQAVVRFITV